ILAKAERADLDRFGEGALESADAGPHAPPARPSGASGARDGPTPTSRPETAPGRGRPSAMTATLTVLSGPLAGTRFDVDDSGDEVLVGSDPDCRIALDAP